MSSEFTLIFLAESNLGPANFFCQIREYPDRVVKISVWQHADGAKFLPSYELPFARWLDSVNASVPKDGRRVDEIHCSPDGIKISADLRQRLAARCPAGMNLDDWLIDLARAAGIPIEPLDDEKGGGE